MENGQVGQSILDAVAAFKSQVGDLVTNLKAERQKLVGRVAAIDVALGELGAKTGTRAPKSTAPRKRRSKRKMYGGRPTRESEIRSHMNGEWLSSTELSKRSGVPFPSASATLSIMHQKGRVKRKVEAGKFFYKAP